MPTATHDIDRVPADWFPEATETTEPSRAVYLKLSGDRWTVCQRPTARRSRYSQAVYHEGRQANGCLVVKVQQVPASVSDAELAMLVNATALMRHLGKANEDAYCTYHFDELGAGRIAR